MSLQVEKLEKNMAKLTIEVPAEEFTEAIKSLMQQSKMRTTRTKTNSASRDSVKVKHR